MRDESAGSWKSVPRARGAGALPPDVAMLMCWCSPRTRGWSVVGGAVIGLDGVFPAHAGLERNSTRSTNHAACVPRACGAEACSAMISALRLTCSPRTRGWSVMRVHVVNANLVFPAHAGLERTGRPRAAWMSDVPCVAGLEPTRLQSTKMRRCVPRRRGVGAFNRMDEDSFANCSPRTWGWSVPLRAGSLGYAEFPAHAGLER